MSGTSKPTSYPNGSPNIPKPWSPTPSAPTAAPNYGGNVPNGSLPQSGNWFSGYTGQLDTTNAQTAAMRDWVVNYLMSQGPQAMNAQMANTPPRTQVGQAAPINTQFGTKLSGITPSYVPGNRAAPYTPYNGGTPPRITGTPGNPGYSPTTGDGGETDIPFRPTGGYTPVGGSPIGPRPQPTLIDQILQGGGMYYNQGRPQTNMLAPVDDPSWNTPRPEGAPTGDIWRPPGGQPIVYNPDGSIPNMTQGQDPSGLDRSMIRNVQDYYQSSGNANRVQDSFSSPGNASAISTVFNPGGMSSRVQTQFDPGIQNFTRDMVREVGLQGYMPQRARDVGADSTQSVDQLGGQNSAFFQNMMAQLQPSFTNQRNLGLAAAKESAGNLTGSGFANRLGASVNRSLGDEQAVLANYAAQGMSLEQARQAADANRRLQAATSNQGADLTYGNQMLQRGGMDLSAQQSNQTMDSTFLNQLLQRGGLNLQAGELGLRGQMANQSAEEAFAQRGLTAQQLRMQAEAANQSSQQQDLARQLEAIRMGQTGELANQSSQQQDLNRVMDAMRLGQQGQIANQGADTSFINQLLTQSGQGLTAQGMGLQAQIANQQNDRSYNENQANLDANRNNTIYSGQNAINMQNAQNFFNMLNAQSTAGIAPNTVTQSSGAGALIPPVLAAIPGFLDWWNKRNG